MKEVYDASNKPRPEVLRLHFAAEGRLSEDVASRLINDAINIYKQEPVLLEVPSPVTGY